MIIILEGCDCTGKTTFANMLSEKTGYEIVKGSSFQISELGSYGMFNHMMSLLNRDNIIIDRMLWSNLVYGELYNFPMMEREQYRELVSMSNKNSLVIYLHAHETAITERMKNRGDNEVDTSEINSIIEKYNKEINGEFAPKLMLSIDTSIFNTNLATSMVAEFVNSDATKTFISN